ncbi:MAG: RNase RNM [Sodalis sp. (in: enterobacteria)]
MIVEPITTSRPVIYDLHSHTTASDGLLTPRELVVRAQAMGVTMLAITDHDTVDGLMPAQKEIVALRLPLNLVAGVEISTLWQHHEIHIVGLGIAPSHPALTTLLASQRAHRLARAYAIAEKLVAAGIHDPWDGARQLAQNDLVTRGHFARYLVSLGLATNVNNAFKKYLSYGERGYIPPQWCQIEKAIEAIHLAGGQAVVAHPGRYQLSTKWLKRLLSHFTTAGGDAMEVSQCQQSLQERSRLAYYARYYRLLASQGSDFHQPCASIELGRKLWLPGGIEPVLPDWPLHAPLSDSER